MLPTTSHNETVKASSLRQSPQALYHNFLVPKKNVDGNFLFEIFHTQTNNKITNSQQNNKRKYQVISRLKQGTSFNTFSQQKSIKTRCQSSDGKYFQRRQKNPIKKQNSNQTHYKHIKTSQDTFLFKKSVDLRENFIGFQNPQHFQKILVTKRRFYHSRCSPTDTSLDKDAYDEKIKQQTQKSSDCRGQKCILLQNYLSQIKRNRDDLVKKKNMVTKVRRKINVNKILSKKTLEQFLPKLNVQKNDINENFDSQQSLKDKQIKNNFSQITAKSFSVLCDGKIIFDKNGSSKRQVASLTKIMTCITGLFLIDKFDLQWETVTVKVSREAVALGGTTSNLKPGDEITLKDLFFGMMLPSGNDAAYSIGQFLGRLLYLEQKKLKNFQEKIRSKTPTSQTDINKKAVLIYSRDAMTLFLREMNNVAKYLQLENTSFTNCHGLSDTLNVSTANDIAILSYHCIQNSRFQQIIQTGQYESKIYSKNTKLNRTQKWINSNLLLHGDKNNQCAGGKTGYTSSAGPCLMTCFRKQNKNILIVLLCCDSKEARFEQTERIYSKLDNLKQLNSHSLGLKANRRNKSKTIDTLNFRVESFQ